MKIDDGVIPLADPRLARRRVAEGVLARRVREEAVPAQDCLGLLELGLRDQEVDVSVSASGSVRIQPIREGRSLQDDRANTLVAHGPDHLAADDVDAKTRMSPAS